MHGVAVRHVWPWYELVAPRGGRVGPAVDEEERRELRVAKNKRGHLESLEHTHVLPRRNTVRPRADIIDLAEVVAQLVVGLPSLHLEAEGERAKDEQAHRAAHGACPR